MSELASSVLTAIGMRKMTELQDEPFEKVVDDKDLDTIEAFVRNEQVWGTVQCYGPGCSYFGRMEGIIEGDNRKLILFVCPECNSIERVRNYDYIG